MGLLNLSHGTSIVLLIVYGLSLLFQVKYMHMCLHMRFLTCILPSLAQDPSLSCKFH